MPIALPLRKIIMSTLPPNHSDNSQICPACGSQMKLRTAKRGRNAGGQFWGCSNYPSCKETVEFNSGEIVDTAVHDVDDKREDFPREIVARPCHDHWQSVFVQSCGLPLGIVEALNESDISDSIKRSLAQWRLDFPYPLNPVLSPDFLNVLGVTESILTRGSLTICSKELEDTLKEVFQDELCPSPEEISIALKHVTFSPSNIFHTQALDSHEEGQAFEYLSEFIKSNRLSWTIIPQVNFSSLIKNKESSTDERCDFLLMHPEIGGVVVEVDGRHHEEHIERDQKRDQSLNDVGIKVFRIPTEEIRQSHGDRLGLLTDFLITAPVSEASESKLTHILRCSKFAHQIQLALLNIIHGGWLSGDEEHALQIKVSPKIELHFDVITQAVDDVFGLVTRIADLYGCPFSIKRPKVNCTQTKESASSITVIADDSSSCAEFVISDTIVPYDIQAPLKATSPIKIECERDKARWFLQYLFRKDDFREGQWETVSRTLKGLDSVVLLPTGGGKSIAFQLSALLLPGRCLVVDPILSLIDDQIDNLRQIGIDRCVGITSQLSSEDRREAQGCFEQGHYLFCYISPERFQMSEFRSSLRSLTTNTPVSLIAIDEAHCVSEWGHDFRTAYLNLGRNSREYCSYSGFGSPPLVALTGTASKIVLKDVQRELDIYSFDGIITPKSFDRPELNYHIIRSRSEDKAQRVAGFLAGLPTKFGVQRSTFFRPDSQRTFAGLVFCPHVNGSYGIVEQASELTNKFQVPVGIYSGTRPKTHSRERWEDYKRNTARAFKRNKTTILACTKAFGMGIDKPNIRYTVHIGIPASIESFYQEAGRAGRDRRRAECALLISNDDPKRTQKLLSPETSILEVSEIVKEANYDESDDIVRALWFHVKSFRGKEDEIEEIALIIDRLGDLSKRKKLNLTWGEQSGASKATQSQAQVERSLHRLVVLGVIEDYTVNYASREFGVRLTGADNNEIVDALGDYASAYQRRLGEEVRSKLQGKSDCGLIEFVHIAASELISFIYEHIELARRRALNEIVQATSTARVGEDLRRRIIDYLEQTEWDERLEDVRASAGGGIDSLSPIIDELISPNDAAALRAAAGRALTSYPDIPGLLLLRGLSEVLCNDFDGEVVRQNIGAAISFAVHKYNLDEDSVAVAIRQISERAKLKPDASDLVINSVVSSSEFNRSLARALLRNNLITSGGIVSDWLIANLITNITQLTN